MAHLLNPNDYLLISFKHNLASSVGGTIGKLEMNANVTNAGVTYEVIHNGKPIYDGPSPVSAAQHYNMMVTMLER